MSVDQLTGLAKNKQKLISIALLAVALLSGVVASAKVVEYYIAPGKVEKIVTQAIDRSKSNPKVVEAQIAKAKPVAENLKKNNLFSPPLPKQNPVKDVLGIFGDEVWINDKWYKVGDMVADAKIIAIGPTSVTVEWDGKKKDFYPIQAQVADASKSSGGPLTQNKEGGGPSTSSGPGQVNVQIQGGLRPGGMRGNFTMMRDRIGNMSPQERERFFREMRDRRERMGGGSRGGRFGGGDRGRGGRR